MKNDRKNARSSSPMSIGEAIKAFVSANRLEDKFDETKLLTYWENIVGTTIASRTTYLKLKKDQLVIKVDSAPLRNELLMSKQKILESVNNYMGKELINSVLIQ
ncbi:MAG: DUF721 domain-containing protein [Cytophagales bacterium]